MIDGPLLGRPVFSRHGIFFWCLRHLVTVRYTFFLVSAIAASRRSLAGMLVWMAVVFVSVLVHEIGHATAARWFGQRPKIELHAMGGHTTWTWVDDLRWPPRLLISFAGPAFGFIAGALAFLLGSHWPDAGPLVELAIHDLVWVNVGWGLFNLMPILPLDGGQMLETALEGLMGADRARHRTRIVSVVFGGAGALFGLATQQPWLGVLCALFTWDNLQRMRGQPGVAFPR